MLYAFLIALAVAVVLGIAYYFELKSSRKQADEQKQLLADYQRLEGKNLLTMKKEIK